MAGSVDGRWTEQLDNFLRCHYLEREQQGTGFQAPS